MQMRITKVNHFSAVKKNIIRTLKSRHRTEFKKEINFIVLYFNQFKRSLKQETVKAEVYIYCTVHFMSLLYITS
jgi:hypothetical protein